MLQDNTLLHTGGNDGSLTESFSVVLQDADGSTDTASLDIQIIDDTPVANDDVASLTEGGPIAVTIDVDTNDDAGADGTLTRAFTNLTGTYGTITLNADGTQTYTLSASGQAAIDALAPGATLTDTFNYTLTDGDGDSRSGDPHRDPQRQRRSGGDHRARQNRCRRDRRRGRPRRRQLAQCRRR